MKKKILLIGLFSLALQVFWASITAQCSISDLTVTKTNSLCPNSGVVSIANNGTCFNSSWKAILRTGSASGTIFKESPFTTNPVILNQLPPGSYYLSYTNGTTMLQHGQNPIVIANDYKPTTVTLSSTPSSCPTSGDGTLTINIGSGTGTGPFKYEILSSSGSVLQSAVSADRKYTFTSGINSGATIYYRVTDLVNNNCQYAKEDKFIIPNATFANIKFSQVVLMPSCDAANCDKYKPMVQVLFGPSGALVNTQSAAAKKQMDFTDIPGNITITLNGTTYNMVRSLTDPYGNSVPANQTVQYYIPVITSATISKGQTFTVKTKQLCSGNETTITKTLKPIQSILKVVATASSTGNLCDLSKNIAISLYRSTADLSKFDNDNTDPYYYHLNCVPGVLEKKNPDGSWTKVKDVSLAGNTKTSSYPIYSDVSSTSVTYRVTYGDGCDTFTSESTAAIYPPKVTLKANYSAFGNTTGFDINASDFLSATKTYTITTVPEVPSITFDASDPYSNILTSRTVTFPITFSAGATLAVTDLPVGYTYKVTVKDDCGTEISATIKKELLTITSYALKNTEGYKNGIRVNVGCGITGASMDYDMGATNIIAYTSVALIRDNDLSADPSNYLTTPPKPSSGSLYGTTYNSQYTAKNLSPGAYTLVFYRFVFDPSANRTYSVIRERFVSVVENPVTNPQKITFPVVIPSHSPLAVQNTVNFTPNVANSGTIKTTIVSGTPVYPIKYELYKEDGTTLVQSYEENDHVSTFHTFTGLAVGSYVIKVNNGSCDSNVSSIRVAIKNYWMGGTAGKPNDWATASNWTGGIVPKTLSGQSEPIEDVEFATFANFGEFAKADLYVDAVREVANFTNLSPVNLIIPPNTSLTVHKNVNILADENQSKKIQIKASATQPTGTLIIKQEQTVQATVEFYNKAYDCANCGFYTRQWQYFGIPVTSSAFPTPTDLIINRWDEFVNGNKWVGNPSNAMLNAFEGYEITNTIKGNTPPQTIYPFTGQLITQSHTISYGTNTSVVTPRTLTFTNGVNYKGMNLIGNSYTAAIPISDAGLTLTNMVNAVYLFNAGTRDQWRKLNGSSPVSDATAGVKSGTYLAVPLNNAGQAGLPDRIPSMHAFFVKVNGTGATLTIKQAGLVQNTKVNNMAWRSASSRDAINRVSTYLVMDVIGTQSADRVWLFENPATTRGFDNGWDGHKMLETGIAQLYVTGDNGDKYQVGTVPQIEGTEFGFVADADEHYTVSLSVTPEVESRRLYLRDLRSKQFIPVRDGVEAVVQGFKGDAGNRFRVVSETAIADKLSSIEVFAANRVITVVNHSDENCTAYVYDAAGRLSAQTKVNAKATSYLNMPVQGVYVVKVVGNTLNETKRIVN